MTPTPADPPLPLFTATIQRGPIEARPAIVYVIGDGEHSQLMTMGNLSALLAALPEEARAELIGPFLLDERLTEGHWMAQWVDKAKAERDAIAAKIEKAMAVVEAAVALRAEDFKVNDDFEGKYDALTKAVDALRSAARKEKR